MSNLKKGMYLVHHLKLSHVAISYNGSIHVTNIHFMVEHYLIIKLEYFIHWIVSPFYYN